MAKGRCALLGVGVDHGHLECSAILRAVIEAAIEAQELELCSVSDAASDAASPNDYEPTL